MNENKSRSLTKGIIWRIISIILLAFITYIFTNDLITVSLVTVVSNTIFLIYYYIHERIWLCIKRPKTIIKRSLAKMFTYITFSAIFVLFPVTFLFTNNTDATIKITLIYSVLKHIMYVFNEIIWYKIKWGINEPKGVNS